MRGRGGVAGYQPMGTAEHRSPNKLWRSNSIFYLSLLVSMASIVTDEEVFAQFKEDSRKQYNRMLPVFIKNSINWPLLCLGICRSVFVGIVLCLIWEEGGGGLKLCVKLMGGVLAVR